MNDRAKELEDAIVATFDYGGGIVCPVTGCAGDAAFGDAVIARYTTYF